MKNEDKTALPKVRIAVLGNFNVGKSALTVRYLTRRFIGEYRSKTDLLYRQTVSLDCGLVDVEIIDVSHDTDNTDDFPVEQIQWADACLIVYSIIDRESFKYAAQSLANIKSLQTNPATYLIANKTDLDHLRQVTQSEGASLATSNGIGFCEVSVAENTPSLYKAFERLLIDSSARPVKQRKFSVSKMIGEFLFSILCFLSLFQWISREFNLVVGQTMSSRVRDDSRVSVTFYCWLFCCDALAKILFSIETTKSKEKTKWRSNSKHFHNRIKMKWFFFSLFQIEPFEKWSTMKLAFNSFSVSPLVN